MNEYDYILTLIQNNFFDCVEDAVDFIQKCYKSNNITLKERNLLFNAI